MVKNLPAMQETRFRSLGWEAPLEKEKEVAQSCSTRCDTMDCSPPGSSVHGILQARILEWVAMSSCRGSSWPRDRTQVSSFGGRFFTVWATREAQNCVYLTPTQNHFLATKAWFTDLDLQHQQHLGACQKQGPWVDKRPGESEFALN